MRHLPNILTFFRIVVVPLVAASVLWGSYYSHLIALILFVCAAITDFLDGFFARLWSLDTSFGRMLDPIADKLLVATCLLVLTAGGPISGLHVWAALIILCREILVSGLREFLAELRVSVPVTRLAKAKTAIQLIAVGILVSGPVGADFFQYMPHLGLLGLWIAAFFTLVTGADYWRHGVKHVL